MTRPQQKSSFAGTYLMLKAADKSSVAQEASTHPTKALRLPQGRAGRNNLRHLPTRPTGTGSRVAFLWRSQCQLTNVACWPIREVAAHFIKSAQWHSGLDLLRLSSSPFDPQQTSRLEASLLCSGHWLHCASSPAIGASSTDVPSQGSPMCYSELYKP